MIFFNNKKHPKDAGAEEVGRFLTYLACQRNVVPATQNQALNALVFKYKAVLDRELDDISIVRAKSKPKISVVFPVMK